MFAPHSTVRPALRTAVVVAALLAGTVLLFHRSLDYDFLNYDDPAYVTDNLHVRAGLTWDGVVWAFTGRTDYWHPLTWLSHMLDWQLFGDAAAGHRLTSVFGHALNAALVFLVLRRLTGAFWTSAFAAALFAWHPLRIESVVWITERKDVMSGFFLLLTVWSYAAYADRRAAGQPAASRYFLTFALFAAGLMCKPVLVVVPALLLVLDWWPLNRKQAWPRLVIEKLPFFAAAAVVSMVTIRMQQQVGAFLLDVPLDARLGNALVSVARYLGKFLWPFDLANCYPHPGRWSVAAVGAALLLFVLLSTLAWGRRGRQPWLLAGWLWFLLLLAPVSGVLQVGFQAMADRYTYLPVLGLQLALLWTLRDLPWLARRPGLVAALAALVLAATAIRTWRHQAVWRDSETLFRHATAVTSDNAFAHAFLGHTLIQQGRIEEAGAESERALAIDPRHQTALFTLAGVREKQGRLPEAIDCYRRILAQRPTDSQSEFLLGALLLRTGRTIEGRELLQDAMTRTPAYIESSRRIARAISAQGRPEEALPYLEACLAVRSDDSEVQHEFALALVASGRAAEQLGRTAEATARFERATRLAPDDGGVRIAWAEVLARRRQFTEALIQYEHAVRLQPGNASAQAGLGYMLWFTGRRDQAVARWEEALRLQPDFPGLRERLEASRK